MSIKNRTAFLVIHGVGPHKPFEDCKAYACLQFGMCVLDSITGHETASILQI